MKLSPCNLRAHWPSIRERALPYLEGLEGGAEELLREFDDGRTTAWINDEAIAVLSLVPGPEGLHLFVRAVVSFNPSLNAVAHVLPDLRRIASDLGAKSIRFRSARPGWLRTRSLGPGWTVAHVEYCTEVV
jgi:hypothetical protein